MFHGLAINQEYWKRRVNIFIACAPVIIPNSKEKLFALGAKLERTLESTTAAAGIYELFGNNWVSISKTLGILIPGFTRAVST